MSRGGKRKGAGRPPGAKDRAPRRRKLIDVIGEVIDSGRASMTAEARTDFLAWAAAYVRDGKATQLMEELLASPDLRIRFAALLRVLDLAVGTPTPRPPDAPTRGRRIELLFTVGGVESRVLPATPTARLLTGAPVDPASESRQPAEPAPETARAEAAKGGLESQGTVEPEPAPPEPTNPPTAEPQALVLVISPAAHVRNLMVRRVPIPWRDLADSDLAEVEKLLEARIQGAANWLLEFRRHGAGRLHERSLEGVDRAIAEAELQRIREERGGQPA